MNAFDKATFKWIPIANQRVEAEVAVQPGSVGGIKKTKIKKKNWSNAFCLMSWKK